MNFSVFPLQFPWPEPVRLRPRIYPVFLPFSGCRVRCVFCAQDVQTAASRPQGLAGSLATVRESLAGAARDLEEREKKGLSPVELAFYGGTFTAQTYDDLEACLDFVRFWKERGGLSSVRCSTRPDAVLEGEPERLRKAGFDCVELGVQSFNDSALAFSRRGYSSALLPEACRAVKEAGLALGIQLMPGMPGLSPQSARQDVLSAIACGPACVRLYPCLVLQGTGLASLWQEGRYSPWQLEETTDFLAEACLAFWRHGIPVIRMGLADDQSLAGHVLAGPRHPALGGMVRGRALFLYLRERLAEAGLCANNPARNEGRCVPPDACTPGSGRAASFSPAVSAVSAVSAVPVVPAVPPVSPVCPVSPVPLVPGVPSLRLEAPRSLQGCFWGHKGELEAAYAALGIRKSRVFWHEERFFRVQADCGHS